MMDALERLSERLFEVLPAAFEVGEVERFGPEGGG
jgi:hypothetical protein